MLDSWTREHPLTGALVLRLGDGAPAPVLAFRPETPLQAGSTTKLLTSVAALLTLGTDFRDPVLAALMRARTLALRHAWTVRQLGRPPVSPDPGATALRGALMGARMHRKFVRATLAAHRSRRPPRRARVLLSVPSPPLPTLLRLMNVESDNLVAECLATDVGVALTGAAAEATGVEAVGTVLQNAALLHPCDELADGCGLSPRTRLSAQTLAGLLAAASATSGWGDVLMESLPSGGEGTLVGRLTDDDVRGRVRAKTGHLRNGSNSLAGIVTTASGTRYAFAFLMEAGGLSAHSVQDELVALLVRAG